MNQNGFMGGGQPGALQNAVIDKEMTLITELYDADKEQYLYTAFNPINPLVARAAASLVTTMLRFKDGFTHAVVFDRGESSIIKLDEDNQLSVKNYPGEAKFVMPFVAE